MNSKPYTVSKSRQAICAIFQFIWMDAQRTYIWRTVNYSVKVHDSLSLCLTHMQRNKQSERVLHNMQNWLNWLDFVFSRQNNGVPLEFFSF